MNIDCIWYQNFLAFISCNKLGLRLISSLATRSFIVLTHILSMSTGSVTLAQGTQMLAQDLLII